MYAAEINIDIYRGDKSLVTWVFYEKPTGGEEIKTDLAAAFSEIKLQIRTGKNPLSKLINSYSVQDNTLEISDTNVLQANLAQDIPQGVYYYDLQVVKTGEAQPITYITGAINVTNDLTR